MPKTVYNRKVHEPQHRRTTAQYPSAPIQGCNTAKSPAKQYTGTELIGIATMHKSNAVPVSNSAAAKDLANMRRS